MCVIGGDPSEFFPYRCIYPLCGMCVLHSHVRHLIEGEFEVSSFCFKQ